MDRDDAEFYFQQKQKEKEPKPRKKRAPRRRVQYIPTQLDRHTSGIKNTNRKEDAIVELIDMKRAIEKLAPKMEKLLGGKIDPEQFIHEVGHLAAARLASLIMSGSDKVALEAAKEVLGLNGMTKVQKVAVANLNPNAPRQELEAFVEGLAKKTGVIEIEEDSASMTDDGEN